MGLCEKLPQNTENINTIIVPHQLTELGKIHYSENIHFGHRFFPGMIEIPGEWKNTGPDNFETTGVHFIDFSNAFR